MRPISPSSLPASPKRCWRPRSASPPQSRQSSSTTCSRARSRATARCSPTPPRKCCASSAATSTARRAVPAPRPGTARSRPRSETMSVRLDHGELDLAEVHEINVTPFIDVILVLLIIFMIAAPLATVDISVDLPAANAERSPRPDKPLFLTLKSDLSLTLDNASVDRSALGATLDEATAGDKQQRVFLRADKTVPYGELMTLMNELRTIGYLHVALVGLEAEKL